MIQEDDCPESLGHFPTGVQLYSLWQCTMVDELVLEASEF